MNWIMKPINIDKHIPIPARRIYAEDFPLDKMKIGDSFVFELLHHQQLSQAISHHHKRKGTKRFTTRKLLENNKWIIRCWRVR